MLSRSLQEKTHLQYIIQEYYELPKSFQVNEEVQESIKTLIKATDFLTNSLVVTGIKKLVCVKN